MTVQLMFRLSSDDWVPVKDGDATVRNVFDRHYSRRRYRDGRRPKLFVGPGEKLVLRTVTGDAICVWRKFISDDGQEGVNLAVFRNEGNVLSSTLIRGAVDAARRRWPIDRFYTYVDPKRILSPNPGYCFKRAGWMFAGRTGGGLHVLESLPGGASGRCSPPG